MPQRRDVSVRVLWGAARAMSKVQVRDSWECGVLRQVGRTGQDVSGDMTAQTQRGWVCMCCWKPEDAGWSLCFSL